MKKTLLSSLVLLILFFGSFIPSNTKDSKDGSKIEFTEFTLKNGLHVILHEDHSVPLVAVTVLYHVGSKNEEPNRTGFAHFFEHLLFEGSKNIKRGEFDDYIENSGGMNNANTSQDRTFYYEVMPSNQLELALWLESERMLHARVDSTGIETQRQVVKEERRQRIDNRPYGSLLEETLKRVYTKHPYKSSVIGSMDHLDAAEEKDYKNFYEKYYVPNNAVVSIAGDIDTKTAQALVEKYFSGIPQGKKVVQPQIIEPPQTVEVRDTVYDNIQLPLVLMAYRIPSMKSNEAYQVEMLSSLLAAGQSSRIYKELVDKKQKAVAAGCFPMLMEDSGLLLIYAIANTGVSAEELEKLLQAEIDKVKNENAGEREFQKLRNMKETEFVNQNASMMGMAGSLPNYYVFYGNTNLINTELEKYLTVSSGGIKNVAQKFLNNNNRVVLYYLPKSAKNNQN